MHPDVIAIRDQTASVSLKRAAKEKPSDPLYSRGVPLAVADMAIGPPDVNYQTSECAFWRNGETIADKELWTMRGDVYFDGSCDQRSDAGITRSAWVVVEVNIMGEEQA